ncbi:50S ribosomal protein L18 [Candidatus Peregrinibacteria bacterium]|nr:MAG: 50S ribosomal protein L18 [Candidatus Peregrinibacteria bacterium]
MNSQKAKNQKRAQRHVRIRARISGTDKLPRLIVFRSLRYIYAQLVDDTSGKILVAAHDMQAKSGNKVERAKAVGLEVAEKAKTAGLKACVFDRNGYKYHGRVAALAEGAREGGLKF